MRRPRAALTDMLNNPVLIGTVTILVVIVAVYLSYIAENGLPFVPTYDLNVQVADGGELNKNVDVRIGGARVGQVLKVTPEPATKQWPHPYAQLQIAIDKSLAPLPADTRYQVRLASVLGGQYLELFPGKDHAHTVPDGGTLALSTNPKRNHNIPYVDLSAAFDVFGPKTQQGIRAVSQDLGDAFAGRGAQLNDAIQSTRQLLGPLDSILTLLASPDTQLATFIDGLSATTSALAPVAPTISSLLQNGATTAGALDKPALGATIDQLPATEQTGATVLTNAVPVLAKLASITQALKPAAAYLPTAASHLDTVLRTAPQTLNLLGPVSTRLESSLRAARTLAADPASRQAFQVLGVNDLGTTGSSAFVGLGAIINTVSAAQQACNLAGLWVRNFASTLSEGNSSGNWLRMEPIFDLSNLAQPSGSKPSSDLHITANPIEQGGQCQAGNEVYSGTQSLGDPGHTSATVDDTTPPAGVYQLGQKAGLVP